MNPIEITTWALIGLTWLMIGASWWMRRRIRDRCDDIDALVEATREAHATPTPIDQLTTAQVEAMSAHLHSLVEAMTSSVEQLDDELALRYSAAAGIHDAEVELTRHLRPD